MAARPAIPFAVRATKKDDDASPLSSLTPSTHSAWLQTFALDHLPYSPADRSSTRLTDWWVAGATFSGQLHQVALFPFFPSLFFFSFSSLFLSLSFSTLSRTPFAWASTRRGSRSLRQSKITPTSSAPTSLFLPEVCLHFERTSPRSTVASDPTTFDASALR